MGAFWLNGSGNWEAEMGWHGLPGAPASGIGFHKGTKRLFVAYNAPPPAGSPVTQTGWVRIFTDVESCLASAFFDANLPESLNPLNGQGQVEIGASAVWVSFGQTSPGGGVLAMSSSGGFVSLCQGILAGPLARRNGSVWDWNFGLFSGCPFSPVSNAAVTAWADAIAGSDTFFARGVPGTGIGLYRIGGGVGCASSLTAPYATISASPPDSEPFQVLYVPGTTPSVYISRPHAVTPRIYRVTSLCTGPSVATISLPGLGAHQPRGLTYDFTMTDPDVYCIASEFGTTAVSRLYKIDSANVVTGPTNHALPDGWGIAFAD